MNNKNTKNTNTNHEKRSFFDKLFKKKKNGKVSILKMIGWIFLAFFIVAVNSSGGDKKEAASKDTTKQIETSTSLDEKTKKREAEYQKQLKESKEKASKESEENATKASEEAAAKAKREEEEAKKKAFALVGKVRESGLFAETDVVSRGLRAQMKYADKIGARFSIVLGDDEITKGEAVVKNMETGQQTKISLNEDFITEFIDIHTEDVNRKVAGV